MKSKLVFSNDIKSYIAHLLMKHDNCKHKFMFTGETRIFSSMFTDRTKHDESGTPAGPNDLLFYVGVGVFAIGQLGNLYHHWLLARLRRSAESTQTAVETPASI